MTSKEVRAKYIEFFKDRGHVEIPSAKLVPENDPTTLFTGSGMQPMIPYLLGENHPLGTRIVDSQRCFRSEDIEEVGDNRHTTFFEMLGNWSFGDYFRKEQITWMSEFLFDEIGIDPAKLYVTVFMGEEKFGLPKDTESTEIWQQIFRARGIDAKIVELDSEEKAAQMGMQDGRIFYYNSKKNWWSRAGSPDKMPVGEPGGPDTEMFYKFDQIKHDVRFGEHCHPNCDCGRYLEIGNNVFMTYQKIGEQKFSELPRKNVDFGGGLERITSATNNDPDIFNIDVFWKIIERLEEISNKKYVNSQFTKSFRIVADHTRSAEKLIEDGVIPSNTEQGYVLRRLLRRAVVHADKLGIQKGQLFKDVVGQEEETKFRKTLDNGIKEFEKGERDAFLLFTSYGFPFELTKELVLERGEKIDEEDFQKKMAEHQNLSRFGNEKKFKGGLADHSDKSIQYHTATHLLHKALRDVLGTHVFQKGSNITQERLRFDFSHSDKMTPEQIAEVERVVNLRIKEALPVSFEDLPIDEAEKKGAIGLFEEKYGDKVRVYKVGDYSMEFCGGPHVSNTSDLKGIFKIKKEEACSAGVRRIKAVLE